MIKKVVAAMLAVAAIIVATVFVVNFINNKNETETPIAANNTEETKPDPKTTSLDEQVESELSKMTLDQKIAQMLIVEAPALTINANLSKQLSTAPYGGFIFMANAFGTYAETRSFVQKLRESSAYPLIISADQEGGNVQRIQAISSPKATAIPYASDMAAKGSTDLIQNVGEVVGRELSAIGINVDYAPIADVNSNPNNPIIGRRSFSNDPNKAAEYSQAFANGLLKNNVTPVFKHFPGHGDTDTDSHVGLPVVNKTRAELDALELIPFKKAIEAGAEMIMVAHIALPQITGDKTPATMSYKITTELLRDELGYKGLIVTDGVNMGALAKNYPEKDIYYRVVEAGADLVLLPTNPQLAISSIKEHISEARINESVRRILHYKYGSMSKWNLLDESNYASAQNQSIVDQLK